MKILNDREREGQQYLLLTPVSSQQALAAGHPRRSQLPIKASDG